MGPDTQFIVDANTLPAKCSRVLMQEKCCRLFVAGLCTQASNTHTQLLDRTPDQNARGRGAEACMHAFFLHELESRELPVNPQQQAPGYVSKCPHVCNHIWRRGG